MTTVREEHRLVTSMFVDVVGSTELTMQLGDRCRVITPRSTTSTGPTRRSCP